MEVLENESLATLDPQQKAELIPLQYIETISDPIKTEQQPGLIFSRENLLVIKRYVKAVDSFPGASEPISEWIDFVKLGVDGEGVSSFISDLNQHAEGWEPLERETQALSVKLENFAQTFATEGALLVSEIRSMHGNSLSDIEDAVLEQLETVPLDQNERTLKAESIHGAIEDIKELIDRISKDIDQVQTRADRFYKDVEDTLLPKLAGLDSTLDIAGAGERAAALADSLRVLDEEIEYHSSVISGFTGFTLFGLTFSPLGVGLTYSLFGDLAKRAKQNKQNLQERREELVMEMQSFTPQLANLATLSGLLNDIKGRLKEVNTAAWNLRYVIRTLSDHTKVSSEELDLLDTHVSVERFARRIDRVVRPWHKIGNISHELALIFNDVMKSFNQEN